MKTIMGELFSEKSKYTFFTENHFKFELYSIGSTNPHFVFNILYLKCFNSSLIDYMSAQLSVEER